MAQTKIFDVIVVGAGPAGVSCATWLKQLGFDPVLIDRNAQCGGLQLSNPYTNTWIATSANVDGADVAAAMHANVLRHNVETRLATEAAAARIENDVVEVKLSTNEVIRGRYLVLAGGVSPKTGGYLQRLGLIVGPGQAVAKTEFKGTSVAILGGGDSAFENYRFAMQRGAVQVTIFARSLRARAEQLQGVPPEHVVVGNCHVDAVKNTVNGLEFDHILVLYGYEANREALLGLELTMRTNGFVWTGEECLTNHANVYAIGELAQRSHPCCVTAMADGVVVAKAIQRRLEAGSLSRFTGMAKRALSLSAKALS